MELAESDRKRFHESGIVLIKHCISKEICADLKQAVLEELDRLQFRVGGKLSSAKIKDLPLFQQTTELGQRVKIDPAKLNLLFPEALLNLMNSLASVPLMASQPQLLISFPHKLEWSLDKLNWHVDIKIPQQDVIPGIQAFVLIDDLKPHGGATLALSGSHRPPYVHDRAMALALPREKNVEMSGRAGDVYLMDMRVLHSPSVNATKDIRMMATRRYIR
jgi:hypothetical protein